MSESEPGIGFYRRRWFWAAALLFGVTAIAYVPALRGGFVWDDDTFLTRNRIVRAADGLYRFWFTTDPTDYWPVTSSVLWFEWRLWGMNPLGYHAVNLGLHLAEVFLLWAVLRRLRFPAPYLAAFLFAVHPVNVESVAWIAQLKNLMAMLFYLLAILFFLRSDPDRRGSGRAPLPEAAERRFYLLGDYAASLLCFVLAMLSKGSVAILPLVLLGIVLWRRPAGRRDCLRLAPFFVVSAVLAAVDVWFQKHGTGEVFRSAGGLERLLGAAGVVWFYLSKALLPLNLVFIYPPWHIDAGDPRWWAPLLAAMALTAMLFRYRARGTRAALFAWGYFCAALLPVMGFTDVYFMKFSLVADHYQHIAIIGVIGLVAAGWARWDLKGGSRKAEDGSDLSVRPSAFRLPPFDFRPSTSAFPRLLAGAVIALLAILTWRQCGMYRDAETLYRTILSRNPDSLVAQNNLGNVLAATGRLPEAMTHFEAALRIDRDFPDAHNNRGTALVTLGRLPEATAELEEALRLRPDYVEALVNLGNVREREGRKFEAIVDYEKALKLEPGDAAAHNDLGIALAGTGQPAAAVAELETALRLSPGYADALCNLGNTLVTLGRVPEAIGDYEQALRAKPDDAAAHAVLGAALADQGRAAEAAVQYAEAVRLQPDTPETRYNLGLALAQSGRLDEAMAQFREAVRLKPDYAEACANLGVALASAGRLPEAAAQLEQAARLSPRNAQIHSNLAAVLHALGSEDESRAEAEAAKRLGAGQ